MANNSNNQPKPFDAVLGGNKPPTKASTGSTGKQSSQPQTPSTTVNPETRATTPTTPINCQTNLDSGSTPPTAQPNSQTMPTSTVATTPSNHQTSLIEGISSAVVNVLKALLWILGGFVIVGILTVIGWGIISFWWVIAICLVWLWVGKYEKHNWASWLCLGCLILLGFSVLG
jgi:hypothetical protein